MKGGRIVIKYFGIAFALKAFSFSSKTKQFYRFLGNRFGARRRLNTGLPVEYKIRAKWFLNLFNDYHIKQDGARLLELGTGWVHWDSTIIRLFYDANCTLFDVWDNRQFQPFKTYIAEFLEILEPELQIPSSRQEQARKLARKIVALNSFDEVYHLLGSEYMIEPTGVLRNLQSGTYDACLSYDVFEHIDRNIISDYLKDLYRVLQPGGYSFHSIDLSDHLANYDRNVCRKNYLRYSDAVWQTWFNNDVQYVNRIQRQEWLELFSQAGFELIKEESVCQILRTRIHKQYEYLNKKDLECTALKVIHRRPLKENI